MMLSLLACCTAMADGTVANTLAEDEDTLIVTYADKFEQLTYTDADTGLSITYNLYLPDGYDASASYPMVVFIGDSSCVGSDTYSLTQGRGALVWATDEWQQDLKDEYDRYSKSCKNETDWDLAVNAVMFEFSLLRLDLNDKE